MTSLPRALLFTSASRPDRFLKAAASNADAVILDLEDAVAEDGKAEARRHVVQFLEDRPQIRQKIIVRVNPTDQVVGLEDLAALARLRHGPDLLLIPKGQAPGDLAAVSRVLDDAGSAARLAVLVETALGIASAVDPCPRHGEIGFSDVRLC